METPKAKNPIEQIVEALDLNNQILEDLKPYEIKEARFKEDKCPYCGNKNDKYLSNGNKILRRIIDNEEIIVYKIPRYICTDCNKTFYLSLSEKKLKNEDIPLDYRFFHFRNEYNYIFLHKYFMSEYELMLRKIISNKKDPRYNEVERVINKARTTTKTTINDIINSISTTYTISTRTISRWKNKTRKSIEKICIKYSDKELDNDKWYALLKIANFDYPNDKISAKKMEFLKSFLLLLLLAEDIK